MIEEEKSITFVVPVYGKSGKFLPRCLISLLKNQRYDKIDVIVVYDGYKQDKLALSQKLVYKGDKRISFHTIKHGGACKARNKGLDLATGDYICFFDCDSILQGGAVKIWLNAFEENPDVGFVYNGYNFTMIDNYQTGVPTKEFDKWELSCNNYISSMNPIKRELCPRWDEKLKGLQDWDLFLTLTDNGIIGKKLDEVLVITEHPDENSITGYTHSHWLEVYNKVREKHGIINRDIAVTSMGATFQAKRRAKFLKGDYRDPQMLAIKEHDYKAVISMGYYVDSTMPAFSVFYRCGDDCKKIMYFIGTDVVQLQNTRFLDVRYFAQHTAKEVDKIFCNAPWLQKELKEMGIDAELLYCPIDAIKYEVTPLPKDFTVAVYRSDSNLVHNEAFIFDVAKSCPDINFKFFGGSKLEFQDMPNNVTYHGTIKDEDMPKFIESTSCILRITMHDGFPATLCEWALSGRPFISNLPDMPYNNFLPVTPTEGTYLRDKQDTIKALRNMQRNLNEFTVDKQYDIRKFFQELMSPDKFVKRIREVVDA